MPQQERKPLKRFCPFQSGPVRWWEAIFRPGPLQYLVHLERLAGLAIKEFRYVWAIDDFDATLSYKGCELKLWMDWEGGLTLMSTEDVSPDIFGEVCEHLKHYRWVSGLRVAKLQKLHKKPAKVTWYEK